MRRKSGKIETYTGSCALLQALAHKGIFFIGNAIHAEPILGGEGANAAMVDGFELADCIASSGVAGISNRYEKQFSRWESGVGESGVGESEMAAS